MTSGHQVFHGAHVRKKLNILKGPGNPKLRHTIGLLSLNLPVLKEDTPFCRLIDSIDAVEKGRLAGAIRTDDGKNGTFADLKMDIAEGIKTPNDMDKLST